MGPVCWTSLSTGLSEWELGPGHPEWSPITRTLPDSFQGSWVSFIFWKASHFWLLKRMFSSLFVKRFYIFMFRNRGREGEKERNIDQLPFTHTPSGYQTQNPGTFTNRESNWQPFILQKDTQPTKLHWSELFNSLKCGAELWCFLSFLLFWILILSAQLPPYQQPLLQIEISLIREGVITLSMKLWKHYSQLIIIIMNWVKYMKTTYLLIITISLRSLFLLAHP